MSIIIWWSDMSNKALYNISTQQIQIFLKAVELKNFTQVANYFNYTPFYGFENNFCFGRGTGAESFCAHPPWPLSNIGSLLSGPGMAADSDFYYYQYKESLTFSDMNNQTMLGLNPTMHPTYNRYLLNFCETHGIIPNIVSTYRTVRSLMFSLPLYSHIFIGDTINSDWVSEDLKVFPLPDAGERFFLEMLDVKNQLDMAIETVQNNLAMPEALHIGFENSLEIFKLPAIFSEYIKKTQQQDILS